MTVEAWRDDSVLKSTFALKEDLDLVPRTHVQRLTTQKT